MKAKKPVGPQSWQQIPLWHPLTLIKILTSSELSRLSNTIRTWRQLRGSGRGCCCDSRSWALPAGREREPCLVPGGDLLSPASTHIKLSSLVDGLGFGRKTTNLFNVIQVGNKIFTSIIPKLVSIFKNYEIFISKHKLLQSPISYHFHCLNLSLDTISLSAGRQCLPWISSPSCICYHHHLNCSPSFSKSL